MIVFEDLKFNHQNQISNLETLSRRASFFVRASKYTKSTNALKVQYFKRILNFIRLISLYIICKNDFKRSLDDKNNHELRIVKSFIDLLYNFNILNLNGEAVIDKKYDRILTSKKQVVIDLVEKDKLPKNLIKHKMFLDFLFVKDLIKKYRDPNYEFIYVKKNKDSWENMIEEGKLDYEIRLAETLYELSRLEIPNKIKAPFDEDYYTESGRNAFKNFTQYKFIHVFTKIVEKREQVNVLDIGCGYGNYIDVLSVNYPMFQISGIETQKNVYEEVSEKFKQTKNVDIIHGDFFKYEFQKKFDIVLLNYVLFYFNAKEKSDLLARVKEILSEDGSIIVCQYFSNIEHLKKDLALKQSELSPFKEIEMFYSNKILYANTLWNDSADTFSESVKWDEFVDIVAENNLKIKRITNADSFYYSLFIELIPEK